MVNLFLYTFKKHRYTTVSRNNFLEDSESNSQDDEAIANFDSSENYPCTNQDKVRAAYFAKKCVTVHQITIYRKLDGEELHTCSLVIVSGSNHDVNAIALFPDELFDFLNV